MQLRNFQMTVMEVPESGVVSVRVMPYGVSSERYDFWTDTTRHIQFDAQSLDMGKVVPLSNDHGSDVLDRIGVLENHESRVDGLYAELVFAQSQKAQDTRELLQMGAIDEVSAGVWLDDDREFTDDDGVAHLFGTVDHVSIVPHSQFGKAGEGSKVLAVHNSTEGVDMPEVENGAPVVEPVEEVPMDYASQTEVDVLRKMVAEMSVPGVAQARPTEYKSLGEIIVDVNAHGRGQSAEATERLTGILDAGAVTRDGKGISLGLESFAFAGVGNSIGNGVAYDPYIPDLLLLLRQGRPTVDLMQKRQLPAEGNRVFMPAVSVGNTVGYQVVQGDTLASTVQTQILTDRPKATIGGGQGVTVQAQMWTNPSYMEAVASDLTEAYAEFQNDRAINGDPAVDTPVTLTGYTGILETVGTTDVPVTGAPEAIIPLLGTAWAAVWNGTRRAPSHVLMTADMWGALINLVDTDGRPLIVLGQSVNEIGQGDAGSPAGTLRGLTVVIDDSVGATDVIVTNFRDTLMFEESGSPAQLRLTYPDVLVTDISIFGFSSLFIRRPAAYAILSGITIP